MIVYVVYKEGPEWGKIIGIYKEEKDANEMAIKTRGTLNIRNNVDSLTSIKVRKWKVE